MAGLLRRLRREKPPAAGEPAEAEAPESVVESDSVGADPAAAGEMEPTVGAPPPPTSTVPGVHLEPPTPTPEPAVIVTGPPPPLPTADTTAAPGPVLLRSPLVRCFLCGAEMEGSFCPTCRMIWRD